MKQKKSIVTKQLPPQVAEVVSLLYKSAQAGSAYAESIRTDKEAPALLQADAVHLKLHFDAVTDRINRRIPQEKNVDFEQHVKNTDPLILDNIKYLFARMDADQQAALETVAEHILKRQFVLEHVESL